MSEFIQRRVALVTLGCARNEVDSEELAARLGSGGWSLTEADDEQADVIMVNTCGFIEAAKKDSVDTLLAAADTGKHVVAVGCMAERYGSELAQALPEADAVLGFDSYADIAARLDDVAAGRPLDAHRPRDRRTLLPLAPAARPAAAMEIALPGHAWLPGRDRVRLADGPVAYLKLASGCDRRCSFCAIPSFRGAFVSRPPAEVLAEAAWLASQGARELVLVSENSTSYGKDLSDLRALESLLPSLTQIEGIDRVRVSYLQPAELRPSLLQTIATTADVAAYFDLSFQHASASVLRRMKRFGSPEAFMELLDRIRVAAPAAGVRSNFIVGFPGESEAEFAELEQFLVDARLDVVGIFGYSDEEGTDASGFEGKLAQSVVDDRVAHLTALAEELMLQRAEDRLGEVVEVLIEEVEADPAGGGVQAVGRAAHQGPEVDGVTTVLFELSDPSAVVGSIIAAKVIDVAGVDLVGRPVNADVGVPAALGTSGDTPWAV